MKFNKENMGKYNVMKSDKECRCSICNKITNYTDFWCQNNFCSTECQEKYYEWVKKSNIA